MKSIQIHKLWLDDIFFMLTPIPYKLVLEKIKQTYIPRATRETMTYCSIVFFLSSRAEPRYVTDNSPAVNGSQQQKADDNSSFCD